jgi:segregation and condensation protein B
MDELIKKIEAVLFWRGEPISGKRLAEILKVGQTDLNTAIEELKIKLTDRGITIIEKENELTLGTAPAFGELIATLEKEELNKQLSKASLETLSIILYKNGASRAEIDYIRGVNSNFILRALSVRGLVERAEDPSDARRYIYKPTFELLQFMGIKSVEELPEFELTNKGLAEASVQNEEQNPNQDGKQA